MAVKKSPFKLPAIRSDDEHSRMLAAVLALMRSDPKRDTAQGQALDILVDCIRRYEKPRFRFETTKPAATRKGSGGKKARKK